MNFQFKKGVLELCVLSMLDKRDCYGYDVSEFLSRHIDISESTMYPILRKLKMEGLVTTYIDEDSGGPPRKYYKLTRSGKEVYASGKNEWTVFANTIQNILEGKLT